MSGSNGGQFTFPEALSSFLREHQSTKIRLVEDYSPAIAEQVALGEVDLGLLSTPIQSHLVDLDIHPLPPAPLRLVVPVDDPIAKEPSVSIDALKNRTLVMGSLRPESGFYIQLMHLLQNTRSEMTFRDGIYPTAMIVNLVAKGLGWTMITEDSLDPERSDVVFKKFSDPSIAIERAIVSRKASLTPAARRFRDSLLQQFETTERDSD